MHNDIGINRLNRKQHPKRPTVAPIWIIHCNTLVHHSAVAMVHAPKVHAVCMNLGEQAYVDTLAYSNFQDLTLSDCSSEFPPGFDRPGQ
jgi:hypothetical protein